MISIMRELVDRLNILQTRDVDVWRRCRQCILHVFRLVHMLNKRYLEKLKAVWWNSEVYKSKCAKATDQSEGISIQNIGGVFILILVGIGMACVTLIYEYCVYKYQKAPKTQVESSKTGLASIGRRYVRDSTEKSIKLRRRKTNLPTSFRTLKIHNR